MSTERPCFGPLGRQSAIVAVPYGPLKSRNEVARATFYRFALQFPCLRDTGCRRGSCTNAVAASQNGPLRLNESMPIESGSSALPPVGDLLEGDARIAALRQRDPRACEALVRERGGQMLTIARRYLQTEQDCEDAVQEAFISAFHAIEQFAGNSTLETWLHRILVNACLMKLRGRARRHEVSFEALLPKFDPSGHHSQAIPSWRRMPEDQLLLDETRATVRRCIDMLPDEYRTVLLLRDIEQLSAEEVADLLNATPGAIKTRLHRARQALRTLLEPHFAR
jgi:RNA polymerase sigma-70 factor (ECF subfamily)